MNDLINSFLNTNYTVYPEEGKQFIININQANFELHQFLNEFNASTFAFITAWNPQSNLLSPQKNQARNKQLQEDLKDYTIFPAAGVPANGENWIPEASFFILNIKKEDAFTLAEKYDQLAFVFGEINELPKLIWNKKRPNTTSSI